MAENETNTNVEENKETPKTKKKGNKVKKFFKIIMFILLAIVLIVLAYFVGRGDFWAWLHLDNAESDNNDTQQSGNIQQEQEENNVQAPSNGDVASGCGCCCSGKGA